MNKKKTAQSAVKFLNFVPPRRDKLTRDDDVECTGQANGDILCANGDLCVFVFGAHVGVAD